MNNYEKIKQRFKDDNKKVKQYNDMSENEVKECEFYKELLSTNKDNKLVINIVCKATSKLCEDCPNCQYRKLQQLKEEKTIALEALEKIATQTFKTDDRLCNLKLDTCTNDCKSCFKNIATQAIEKIGAKEI